MLSNDASTQTTVLTEDQFAIQVYTGEYADSNFINGVRVTLLDLKNKDAKPITLTTDAKGRVIFESNRFVANKDKTVTVKMDVEAEDQGYRSFGINSVNLKLGQTRKEPLTAMNGQPYVYSADFKGIDILRDDFDMLYSDMNDMEFEIRATVCDPYDNASDLMFSYWTKDGIIVADYKQVWDAGTGKQGDTYIFRGTWKKTLTPFVSKGFLDFWARFIGGINFRLLLVMSGDEKSTISGTASINFTVGVTLLVLTLSKEVYNKSNIKLFDDVPLSNAMPPLQQYAVKPNAPEEVVPASQEPLSYPALNQSVRFAAYISDSDAGPNNAKVVTVGNQQ